MQEVKVVIGLGNPGPKYVYTRHNAGFLVVDQIADSYGLELRSTDNMQYTSALVDDRAVYLIKPQTFMNESGAVVPWLVKKGIKTEHILVVHDELDFPFGKVAYRFGGSARGHNGLKSIISACGYDFGRIRVGIGRPEDKRDVPHYVLQHFDQSNENVMQLIDQAVELTERSMRAIEHS